MTLNHGLSFYDDIVAGVLNQTYVRVHHKHAKHNYCHDYWHLKPTCTYPIICDKYIPWAIRSIHLFFLKSEFPCLFISSIKSQTIYCLSIIMPTVISCIVFSVGLA